MLAKFNRDFQVRKNNLWERLFQQARSTTEQACSYGDMQDELLRNHLVVGIWDATLSDNLQLDAKLILDTAKKAIRQKEAVKEQREELTSQKADHVTIKDVTWKNASRQLRSQARARTDRGPPQRQSVNHVGETNIKMKRSAQPSTLFAIGARNEDTLRHMHCQSKVAASTNELQTEEGDMALFGTLGLGGSSM